jgi:hypothetical protein
MERARRISGLSKNINQGGGDKKQGLASSVGIEVHTMLNIKNKTAKCKCVPKSLVFK